MKNSSNQIKFPDISTKQYGHFPQNFREIVGFSFPNKRSLPIVGNSMYPAVTLATPESMTPRAILAPILCPMSMISCSFLSIFFAMKSILCWICACKLNKSGFSGIDGKGRSEKWQNQLIRILREINLRKWNASKLLSFTIVQGLNFDFDEFVALLKAKFCKI